MIANLKYEEMRRLDRRIAETRNEIEIACKTIAKNQPTLERLEAELQELEDSE